MNLQPHTLWYHSNSCHVINPLGAGAKLGLYSDVLAFYDTQSTTYTVLTSKFDLFALAFSGIKQRCLNWLMGIDSSKLSLFFPYQNDDVCITHLIMKQEMWFWMFKQNIFIKVLRRQFLFVLSHCFSIALMNQTMRKPFYGLASARWYPQSDYHQISNIRCTQYPNINASRLVLQWSLPNPLEPGIKDENEDVVGAAPIGDAPTTSEWSTILLPTKVRLILETLR